MERLLSTFPLGDHSRDVGNCSESEVSSACFDDRFDAVLGFLSIFISDDQSRIIWNPGGSKSLEVVCSNSTECRFFFSAFSKVLFDLALAFRAPADLTLGNTSLILGWTLCNEVSRARRDNAFPCTPPPDLILGLA